jgi:Cu/Ag efflux protein CusF
MNYSGKGMLQMFSMMKWLSAPLAVVVMTNMVMAADTVAAGTVKSISAENKTFILTDSVSKDHTFKIGENLIVNRGGKEGKSDLKAGDVIHVSYDKGFITWTSNYILVREGATKNHGLVRGIIKGYDVESKKLLFSNESQAESSYPVGDATVRLNLEDCKISDVKIGDHALIIVDNVEGTSTLKCVMAERAK